MPLYPQNVTSQGAYQIPYPFVVPTFELIVGFIKEFGGVLGEPIIVTTKATIQPGKPLRLINCHCTTTKLGYYHNPSFGLTTKAKGLQGCGPRESPGVTSHTPGSVGKCEGMNPHTPKATPTLGDGVPVNFQTSKSNFKGQNSMSCGVFYIIENILERRCLKWARIAHLDI